MAVNRVKISARQINALILAEGISKFCVLLPILTIGIWRGRGLGLFTAACAAGCLITSFLERCMWAEETLFQTVYYNYGRKTVLALYFALFWFFLAQIPVMLRISAGIMLHYFRAVSGDGILKYSFFFLPFLISCALNTLFYMRKLYIRLYKEGVNCCKALQKTWILNIRDWLWWGLVLLVLALALGFRDQYSVAGFYCAYNWQVMCGFFLAAWLAAAVRRKMSF